MTGHTNHIHACIQQEIGGAILCRRDEAPNELAFLDGALLHRAPRAGCLTGPGAGTLVTRSVYADSFLHRNIDDRTLPVMRLGTLQKGGTISPSLQECTDDIYL